MTATSTPDGGEITPTQQALLDHQASCGCVLPSSRMAAPEPQSQAGPEQQALGGIFGLPITVPSMAQNRTTQTIGRHKRHPTNQIKPELYTMTHQPPKHYSDVALGSTGTLTLVAKTKQFTPVELGGEGTLTIAANDKNAKHVDLSGSGTLTIAARVGP